ncbi:hypothetical protein MUK42_22406 [Musa troglodytarum]|uniref:Uncharacterized protein n=1 Tax=Musa troglodytarum TaxID=320322 RepID=A0A9E7HGP3_9LILI|nr:hypothetical protein MUK42_22406 [Musa troglodytarum]
MVGIKVRLGVGSRWLGFKVAGGSRLSLIGVRLRDRGAEDWVQDSGVSSRSGSVGIQGLGGWGFRDGGSVDGFQGVIRVGVHKIEWSVKGGPLRNIESARVSVPSTLVYDDSKKCYTCRTLEKLRDTGKAATGNAHSVKQTKD